MAAVCVCVSLCVSVCGIFFRSQLLQKFTDFNIPLTKMMTTQDPLVSTSAAERKNFILKTQCFGADFTKTIISRSLLLGLRSHNLKIDSSLIYGGVK
jgi:hypothetical protein